jgi:Cu2+-exporting ATPase
MSLSTSPAPKLATSAVCLHCGTPFRPTLQQREYCCSGCQFVHDLIKKNGLAQFYELRGGDAQPVKSLVFQKRDYTWLEDLVRITESTGEPTANLALDMQGVSCLGCVWLIEEVFTHQPGALSVRVDPGLGRLEMSWKPGALDVVAFARKIQTFGYLVGPPGQTIKRANRGLTVRLGICGALALNAMLFTLPSYLGMESTFQYAALYAQFAFALGTLSLLIGGSYFFTRTWSSLRQRVLHIDLPISLGLLAAYASSVFAFARGASSFVYFDFVSIFTFLMLAGRWLQLKVVERNRHLLLAAQDRSADVACLDSDERVPVAGITSGTRYRLASGQPIPVRSKLLSENATLGMEWINGESEALTAPRGRIVPSGAMNYCNHEIELEALEPWSESLLARLTEMPSTGPQRNAQVERFIRIYMLVVLGLGALAFAWWWRHSGDLLVALQVLTSVLVVSCPCASGVALPLADDLAASFVRRLGVFLREGSLWARLRSVRKIIFDKTGTLTLETMALRNPEGLSALSADGKAVLLAMVSDSLHPVSCCLRELLLAEGVEATAPANGKEFVGLGLERTEGREVWRLGRSGWAGKADGDCVFSRNGEVLATFCFEESVRTDAAEEIAALQEQGCEVFILSGDRPQKVATMAARLGVPSANCHATMSPQEKADWVRYIDRHDTLLIGDGANDSLAFNAAHCTGTPAIDRGLLEQKADFYFLGRGLSGIRQLLATAGRRRQTVRRVIGFALLYNFIAITISLAGAMSPVVAAVLMPLSSLVSLAIVFVGRPR